MQIIRAEISGRVQGVSFRYYTLLRANQLGIKGSVKNETNGQVVVEWNDDYALTPSFVSYLHRGSPASLVEEIRFSIDNRQEGFTDFAILR